MKSIYSILIVAMLMSTASGQTYHPLLENGKTWNVLTLTMVDWFTSTYSIEGDTLINGYTYEKLYTNGNQGSGRQYLGAIREETTDQKVYFNDHYSTAEELLYDFSLQKGDTVAITSNMGLKGFPLTFKVDSVDQVIDETGSERKRLLLSYGTKNYGEEWIEGIGSMQGLISPGNFYFMADLNWESLCTKLDGNVLYYNPSFDTCVLEYVGIEEHNETKPYMKIYPNPVESSTVIEISNSPELYHEIRIVNIAGKIVYNYSFTGNYLYLGDNIFLGSGFYFVFISNSRQMIAKGKLMVP
jgi:hypothetical protein